MFAQIARRFSQVIALALIVGACAQKPELPSYGPEVATAPRSVLVVPVVNTSTEVSAADVYLATLAVPLAERG